MQSASPTQIRADAEVRLNRAEHCNLRKARNRWSLKLCNLLIAVQTRIVIEITWTKLQAQPQSLPESISHSRFIPFVVRFGGM